MIFVKKVMFDFEKLIVYQKSKEFNSKILNEIIKKGEVDKVVRDQLRRAALSIPLNIAEGCSRYSKADRRNFYVIAHGSAFECVAALDLLKTDSLINNELFTELYSLAEEICKMLFSMEKQLK